MPKKNFIEVENGEEVASVHHEATSNKWIFFCHGYGSDKEGSYEMRSERAVKEGFNAVRFDFRGNGESDGDFIDQSLSSRINDLKAVINYYNPEKVYLFGMSFGGKVVFHAAEELDVEAVIGKSPVTYNKIMSKFREVVEEKGEYTHFGDKTIDNRFFKDFDKHNFDSVTENLEVPVAIFHGGADTTVHLENSAKAVENFGTETLLYKLKDEKHSLSDHAEEKLLDMMFAWLNVIV